MSRRKPSQESVEHMSTTCRACAVAMLTIGALHVTWATSGTATGRAKAVETVLEVLTNHLGGNDRGIVASVRRAYEAEDAREGAPAERYDGPVTDVLVDAMTACILTAFDEALVGIKGERE